MAIGRVGVRPYSGGTSTTTTTTAVSIDTDAQAFITATAITDTTQKNAINDLVLDLKAAGVWTKMKALYPMVGGTATTHKFNLKDPRDLDAAYRLSFQGGWTHSSTGALPNGSNGYADTFLTPSTSLSLNSSHLSFYSRTDSTLTATGVSGVIDGSLNGIQIALKTTVVAIRVNDATSSSATPVGNTSKGFFGANRNSSTVKKIIQNTNITNINVTSTSLANQRIYLSANNSNGTLIQNYDNKECAFASIGDGLTDLESNLFYQIVEKYQYALGRNVNANQTFYFNRNYSNETNAFIFNGAISDATQQSAINTLVNDLKAAGIWTKMKALYPMVGGTALAHKFNLVNPIDSDAAFRLTFNGGGTHDANGYQTNGSNALADTYLTPSTTLTLNSTHISVYSRTNSAGTYYDLGTQDVTSRVISLSTRWSENSINTRINEGFSAAIGTNTDSRGFYIGSRTASNVRKTYINSTLFNTNSTTSVALPTSKIGIGANFYNNIVANSNYFSNRQYAFASIGDGLTDLESNLFYQIVEKFQYTLGRNVNTAQPFYYNSSYTNETNAFIFNGAVTDATQISAVNTLVTTLKTAGIWTKMKAVYPMVGGTATSHKFNLVNPIDSTSAYALTFNGGWTHSSTGALPNGSNAYTNTNLTPSTTLSLNSTHISYYSRTNSTTTGLIGSQITGGGNAIQLAMGSTFIGGRINDNTYNEPAVTNTQAFMMLNRNSSTSKKFWRNAVSYSYTVTSTSLPNQTILLGAYNNNGGITNYDVRETAFASIGDGLTDAEATTFYNAVQAFQTTLGRQV